MLGGEYISHAEKKDYELLHPFRLIEPHFSDVDIVLANLEGPLFEGSNRRPDVTSLLSNHPAIIDFLKNKSICVLNLANNHTMDYGPEGLEQTIDFLEEHGIYFVGAGRNEIEANREVIIELKGKKIAFLAYTTNERHVGSVLAGPNTPGCASLAYFEYIVEKISDLKKTADIICISLHWGYEYFSFPSPDQIKIAHAFADAGSTYIIGHHPHVVQGLERYNDSLIIYSLGNFFLPPVRGTSGRLQSRKEITKEFMLLKSSTNGKDKPDFCIEGGKVDPSYLIIPYNYNDQIKFMYKIEELSKPLSSDRYNDFWREYYIKRTEELNTESFIEAFKKAKAMPLRELIHTVSFDDIKRNLKRFYYALTKRVS
ncbi:MAG: CapA family protein [Sedimentisphaerales bacterium]|nr:CapA family protein [Sedimentisphaerales bacterium]